MMRSRRAGLVVLTAALALLVLLAPAASAGRQPAPAAPALGSSNVYLPFIAAPDGFQPVTLVVRFWAEQYSLPAGACTNLHWVVTGAKSVAFNGAPAAAAETRQACPGGNEFYQLQITSMGGEMSFWDITLASGDPGLRPAEVIAQGTVVSLQETADTDPVEPGDQPGYRVQLNAIKTLFTGTPGWDEKNVALDLPQSLIDYAPQGPIHWPVKPDQTVEFRANCDGASCVVNATSGSYAYLTSE